MTDNAFAPPRSNVEVREGPEELWAMTWKEVRKLYLAIVALIGLYLLVALLFGIPSVRIIGRAALTLVA